MILEIFLFCFILPFIKGCTDDEVPFRHDPPAMLGPDRFCFFAYSTRAKTSVIRQVYPNAERIGVGRLPYHRLDFNYYFEEVQGSLPTTVPDCGYEVWGAIFSIPIQDLNMVISQGSKSGDQVVFHFAERIIQTYSGQSVINLKCNLFEQIDLPEKLIYGLPLPEDRRPSQGTIDRMVDGFIDAGLPRKYIEEISQLPVRNQNVVYDNRGQNQNQQQGPVIMAPDSVAVSSHSDSKVNVIQDQNQQQQQGPVIMAPDSVAVSSHSDSNVDLVQNQPQQGPLYVAPNSVAASTHSDSNVNMVQNQPQQGSYYVAPNSVAASTSSDSNVNLVQNQPQQGSYYVAPNSVAASTSSDSNVNLVQNKPQQGPTYYVAPNSVAASTSSDSNVNLVQNQPQQGPTMYVAPNSVAASTNSDSNVAVTQTPP